MAHIRPIVFLQNKTKQTRFPSHTKNLYLCKCVCVCVSVRPSGPRPVASQMGVCEEDYHCKPALPTHSLGDLHSQDPLSTPCNPHRLHRSTILESYLERQGQTENT